MRVDDFSIRDQGSVARLDAGPARPASPSADAGRHDSTQISVLAQFLIPDNVRIEQLHTDVQARRYSVATPVLSRNLVTFYLED